VARRDEHTAERVAARRPIAPAQYPNSTKGGDEKMTERGQLQAPWGQVDLPRCQNECHQAIANAASSAEAATEDPIGPGEYPGPGERSCNLSRSTNEGNRSGV
jgi:hypothetical protein